MQQGARRSSSSTSTSTSTSASTSLIRVCDTLVRLDVGIRQLRLHRLDAVEERAVAARHLHARRRRERGEGVQGDASQLAARVLRRGGHARVKELRKVLEGAAMSGQRQRVLVRLAALREARQPVDRRRWPFRL